MIVHATDVKDDGAGGGIYCMLPWLMHASGKCWRIEGVMLHSHIKRPQVFIIGD